MIRSVINSLKPSFSGLFLLAFVVVFTGCSTLAQPGYRYSTDNKKAIKFYEEAMAERRNVSIQTGYPDFDKIIGLLDKATDKDPNFVEALMLKSDMYALWGKTEKAIEPLQEAVTIDPSYSPTNWYLLAKLQFKSGHYETAKKSAETFLGMESRRINPAQQEQVRSMMRSCEFAIEAKKNPVDFEPKNVGPGINTERPEYFPTITGDDQMLLFTRLLVDQNAYGGLQEDFFYSIKQEDGTWGTGMSISDRINTVYNEGAPTLSSDGRTLIFAACALADGYGENRKGFGSCDLFITQRVGDQWTYPANLSRTINSFHWETQPSLSADGKTLYFIKGNVKEVNRQGRAKDPNIYVTRFENGSWTTPEKLPSNINTPGVEASVLIHPDGQTLYFASDGHVGMGGTDLYMSRKQPDGSWGDPVNLGYPINTHADENSLLVAANGEVAFFASDREGGYGALDIYSFEMPESIKPIPTTYMKGVVYDIIDKSKLQARFELIDLETGDIVVTSYSDKMSGEFVVNIPANRDYALNVEKDGYRYYSKNFSLKSAGTPDDPFLMDVPLIPIEAAMGDDAEGIALENVFFELDSDKLKPESKVELNKLYQWLINHENVHIQLHGHTDDQGEDAYNMDLSDRRAKTVMNYLVDKGISSDRLSAKGFGETKPVCEEKTPECRARNRRTEYIITKY